MKRTRLRPVSIKTRAIRWPALRALRGRVLLRARGRCESCSVWVGSPRLEVHHIVKRSQRRDDMPTNAVALCRVCHTKTDRPYRLGRLVITARLDGRVDFTTIFATNKWAARA